MVYLTLKRSPPFATALALCWLLSGCSVIEQLPGMDRLISKDSSAEVGPVLDASNNQPITPAPVEPASAAPTPQAAPLKTPPTTSMQGTDAPHKNPESSAENVIPETSTLSLANKNVASAVLADEPSVTETKAQATVNTGHVSGNLTFFGPDIAAAQEEQTIITLIPKTPTATFIASKPRVYSIDMENKTYLPRYLTIAKNDQIIFVNKDKIKHNVFSATGKNAFDLGTYGAGLKRAVALKETGIVKVYCNIHPQMATFIAVGDPGLTTVASKSGSFSFTGIPVGDYQLHAWNIRAESFQDISVNSNQTSKAKVELKLTNNDIKDHTNKFGKEYPKNQEFLDDEFY